MKFSIRKKAEFATSNWTGGKTTEMAIFPKKSSYLERDFLWRVSSATVTAEESTFTNLPDYDRVIAVISGELVLEYNGERVKRLKELEHASFDGAWRTKSYGIATDFNLMTRKGSSKGTVDVIHLTDTAQEVLAEKDEEMPLTTHVIYCKEGFLMVRAKVVSAEGKQLQCRIGEGDLVVMDFAEDDEAAYDIMGEGVALRAAIRYCVDPAYESDDDDNSKSKSLMDDFRRCLYISNTQFRGAKYVVKSLNHVWYAPPLSSVVGKLEGRYITFIAFFLGLFGVVAVASLTDLSIMRTIWAIIGWILADCFLVSPLIYLALVPRPVKRYMIPIDQLSGFQQKLMESEQEQNEGLNKILKKYKNSGRV